jgi:hypothetical protein
LKSITNPLRGFFALIFIPVIFLFSCNKEPDLIGLDLLPPGDTLGVSKMDTATIVAYSVLEDSVLTSGMIYGVIGSINDQVFGKTTASLYTQIRLTSNAPDFGTNPVVDSVVLILPYYSLFGDSSAMQTFKVYELSESIITDKKYYSNSRVQQSSLLAEKTFLPRVKDSILIDSITKVIPQVRLKFNNQFATKILNGSTSGKLTDNNVFVEFFKGIVITADSGNVSGVGSLVSFNLLSTMALLKMYYRNDSTNSLVYNFGITAAASRFNRYDHNYAVASSELKAQIINRDTSQGKQKLFIQAFGGTKVKLRFPYLKKWATGKKYAINDAQLIMTTTDVTAPFKAPSQLALRAILTDSTMSILPDELEGSVYFDGTYNASKGYKFRLSRYVQQLLTAPETDNKGLFLFVPGASYIGNRLILNGTATTSDKMKLVITYTKIK